MTTLECPVHETVNTLTGFFTYHDAAGALQTAAFCVRCEPKPAQNNPDRIAIMERREDAANDQLTEMWKSLQAKGFTHITFQSAEPDPFC